MDEKIIGIVKCFGGYDRENRIKNYGFIVSEINIGDIYFHKKDINNEEKIINREDVVVFDLIEKNKKLLAINVTNLKDDKDFVNKIKNDQKLLKDVIQKLKDINKKCYFKNFYIKNVFDFLNIRTKLLIDEFEKLLTDEEKLNYYIEIINSNEQDIVIKEKFKKYLLCKNLKTKYNLTIEFLFNLPRCILFDKDILNSLSNKMIIELSKKIFTVNSNQHIYNIHELNIIGEVFANSIYTVVNEISLEVLLSCIKISNNYIDVDRIIKILDVNKKIIFINKFYQELDVKKQKIIDLLDTFNKEIDIDILPEDIYCKELLNRINDEQKIKYIKKVLNYYEYKDAHDFNVIEAKNILQEIYKKYITSTINNMIIKDDNRAYSRFLYFEKMIIEYAKMFNDKDFVNRNMYLLKNNLRTIKGFDNNDYNILIYNLSQLNILDIYLENDEKQIEYFMQSYKDKKPDIIDIFFKISEQSQIRCLYFLVENNRFDIIKLFSKNIEQIDKKSIIYIIMYLLLTKEYSYPDNVDRFKVIHKLIYDYIDNINNKLIKGKIRDEYRPFNLSMLTDICEETSEFCEAQYQYKTKKIYCPKKRVYCASFDQNNKLVINNNLKNSNIAKGNNIVFPYLSNKLHCSKWNLGQILKFVNLFDDRVFREAFYYQYRLVKENYVGKINSILNHANNMLSHMYCHECGQLMKPELNHSGIKTFYNEDETAYIKLYALSSSTVFTCPNYSRENPKHDHHVYLNICSGGCGNVIDSRELNIRELRTFYNVTDTQGYLLCKKCGSGDENFIAGSICPNCGSYRVKTNDGKLYICLQCNHKFRPMFAKKIYCLNCYERNGRNRYDPKIYNINSKDGKLFHCNNCGSNFVKKQSKSVYMRRCNDNKLQILIPIFEELYF